MKSVRREYKNYLKTRTGADNYLEFKKILYQQKDTVVEAIIGTVKDLSDKQFLSVLDVGGGDGQRVVDVLKVLNARYGCSFYLEFVEQSPVFTEDFKKRVPEIEKFTEVNIINSEYENVVLTRTYDLVLVIHSIFAFETDESIVKLLKAVSDGGQLIIVSNSEDGLLGMLKREIDKVFMDTRFEIDKVKRNFEELDIEYDMKSFSTTTFISKADIDKSSRIIFEWLSLGHFRELVDEKRQIIWSLIEGFSSNENPNAIRLTEFEELILVSGKSIDLNSSKLRAITHVR